MVYTLPIGNAADGTVLYGSGTPGNPLGKNDDTYINTTTGIFYKKTAGAWGQVFSMQTGPAGVAGPTGTSGMAGSNGKTILNGIGNPSNLYTGTNGDYYINTANYEFFGPKAGGVWPAGFSLNISGETESRIAADNDLQEQIDELVEGGGMPGPKGETGATGAQGPIGSTGPAGTDGAGVPTGGMTGQALVKQSGADGDVAWTDVDGGSFEPIWNRKGTVLEPYTTDDQGTLGEANLLYEENPQELTNVYAGQSIFKMWFTQGYGSPNICYAESFDGLNWVRRNTICVANHARSCVIKVGTNYYMYASLGTAGTQIDRYTSTDGVNWTLGTSAIIVKNTGSWNFSSVANCSVIYDSDDNIWKMILEGNNSTYIFSLGYYTSIDGITWVEYGSNPVLSLGNRTWGGPFINKQSGVFFMWCHGTPTPSTDVPTDLYRFQSIDMINWTLSPTTPILGRLMSDEGVRSANGQLGDAALIEVNGRTHLFYTATPNGLTISQSHIKTAIANMSLSDLIASNEGDNGIEEPSVIDVYSKTMSDLRYIKVGTTYQDGPIYIESAFDGYQVRDKNLISNKALLIPTAIYFYRASGVVNSLSTSTGGWTFAANGTGGWIFQNTNGNIAYIDGDGNITVNGLTLTNIGTDYGAAFDYVAKYSNGAILKIAGRTVPRVLFTNNNKSSLTNTATKTSIIPTGVGDLNLMAIASVCLSGKQYLIKFSGVYSTPSIPGTLDIEINYCGIVIASGTITGFASLATNLGFQGEIIITTVLDNATTGTAYVSGGLEYSTGNNSYKLNLELNNAGTLLTNLSNKSYPASFDILGTWDSALVTKKFDVTQFCIVSLN